MQNGTYFVAGVYGVGKSSLCEDLSSKLSIPHYSASELISQVNKEQYGASKYVRDKALNQEILASAVQHILGKEKKIILSGHFCIFNKRLHVETLPAGVFWKLGIRKIILLEADCEVIIEHLQLRDKKSYAPKVIVELQQSEKNQAEAIAREIAVPLYCHRMSFKECDAENILNFLIRGG